MLERALIQPQQCSVDPLDNAQSWGIPIWAIDKLQAWLDKIYASFKDANSLKSPKDSSRHSSDKDLKVRHLKGPFIKFESYHRSTRPVFLELQAWPTLNFSGEPGTCPFNTKKRAKVEEKIQKKEVKENRVDVESVSKREQNKEMTRRPRTTATRARRNEQLAQQSYCEICRISYRDLTKHVQTDQHLSFVQNDDNFLSLDTLINAGANVEAFLKLNRTKDIEKDCNLFPNGDRNVHDVVLPEDKVNKSAKSLGDEFGVEEIKMVQCNGARRNLNLKLNPGHNLRARAKHESGHLLRSKGSPWHEVSDKTDKFYDKFEGFTIKKRSKGTIWIEEEEGEERVEDPDDDFIEGPDVKESKRRQEEYKIKSFPKEIVEDDRGKIGKSEDAACNKRSEKCDEQELQRTLVHSEEQQRNGLTNFDCVKRSDGSPKRKDDERLNGDIKNDCANSAPVNPTDGGGCVQSLKLLKEEPIKKEPSDEVSPESVTLSTKRVPEECDRVNPDVVCNGHTAKPEESRSKEVVVECAEKTGESKEEKSKCGGRSSRRGGRNVRVRHRLSVEERLIEDNRAYYKVEVLGSKLRSSSALPGSNTQCTVPKDAVEEDAEKKEEAPSSEKPVVVRFKRVRKSELSLLSDEAESFMFGEPRRDDSSETSDGEQSSVLPRDTESECNDTANSVCLSSPINSSSPVKCEPHEEDSQDSLSLGRARKRRRTQAEALIKDNADYYKFETPGSRLRYQAPLTGIRELANGERTRSPTKAEDKLLLQDVVAEKVYPSKPSPEVEKMQFSFEAVPKSEPWYQTYQRQDEGAEFWHYFSEGDSRKPFLLPYEIENFHETLAKNQSKSEVKRKGRGRSAGCMGRSPRKSPRCHASTLAIMSTIIRKKEQQQQQQLQSTTNLCAIDECQPLRSRTNTPRPDQKADCCKSDLDEELKEMAKTIDEMLGAKEPLELDDSFEPDNTVMGIEFFEANVPKGAPPNLLEILDNCHELANCLENSSCASSECGEGNVESPLKRRKKRKNRTGWPGIKMKKKLQSKPMATEVETDRGGESLSGKRIRQNGETFDVQIADTPGRISEEVGDTMMTANVSALRVDEDQVRFGQRKDEASCRQENGTYNSSAKACHETGVVKRVGGDVANTETLENPGARTHVEDADATMISETRNETDRGFALTKEYAFGKRLSEIDELSENEPGNDENHENVITFRKDVNSMTERRFIGKTGMKRRQRENPSSDTCEPHKDLENQDILCRKDSESRMDSRKHHNSNGLPRKRQQQKTHSDNPDSEIERHSNSVYRRSKASSRKRMYPRKRQRKNNVVSSDTAYEDENCKKDSYLSITCKKQPQPQPQPQQQQQQQQQSVKGGGVKRRHDALSSEGAQDSELECALSERVSPSLMAPSSEIEQRRSSIDFQPVVRMMKIDDQVDMDHSILSVTVASNRRLRSSSSPRSNAQPPKKRLKTSRGQFGRWLKSS